MLTGNSATHVSLDGKDCLYFGGTNYLGLAQRKELKAAVLSAMDKYGLSSGASRLTSGETDMLVGLEEDLAHLAKSEAALVLPAGFLANQVVVETLDDEVDAFVMSAHAHASIQAAVRGSGKQAVVDDTVFGDNGAQPLRRRLGIAASMRLAFFAEPIEPMTGRVLDLSSVLAQMQPHDRLILDEAHSFGVLGEHGRGAEEYYLNLPSGRTIRTGTFSKAVGTYGGFLLGSRTLIDSAKRRSLVFKGSTSLPPSLCAASRRALELMGEGNFALVAALKQNVCRLTDMLKRLEIAGFVNDGVPILYLPYTPQIAKVRDLLPQHAIYIPSTASYFAGYCDVGLRFTVQAGHSQQDLQALVAVLADALS